MKHSTIAMVEKQERVPCTSSLSILAPVLPGVCIAIGMTLFFWPNAGESNAVPNQAVNRTGSSSARTRPIETLCVGDRVLALNPEVSQSERDTFVEPDWTEWLQLSLAMPKADGSLLEIELLRPESWVREQMGLVVDPVEPEVAKEQILSPLMQSVNTDQHPSASPIAAPSVRAAEDAGWRDEATKVDSVPYSPLLPILRDIAFAGAELQLSGEALRAIFVEMDLPELAITGEAIVLDIRGPPPIRPGAGRVVTATFHHSSGDVIDLVVGDLSGEALASGSSDLVVGDLSGKALASGFSDTPTIAASNGHVSDYRSQATDTIGTTSNHPFWSVDRQAYVQAGQLRIGERLHTYSGDTKRVISKLARPGPQPVYNLEVFAEHVYYVGRDGLLVHNSYVAPRGGTSGAQKAVVRDLVDSGFPVRSAIRHAKGQEVRALDILPYRVGRFTSDLPGHEVINNRFMEIRGLAAGRGVGANSIRNPAIALPRSLHASTIQKLQRQHGVWFAKDLEGLTRVQVIHRNLNVLRGAGVSEVVVQQMRRAAVIHARAIGRGT